MSNFRYETLYGFIDVRPSVEAGKVYLWVHEGSKNAEIRVPNNDAPAIAAELLKAAGQEGMFIQKAYEEVERRGDGLACGSGPEWAAASIDANPNWLRNRAANCIAIAEYIENKDQREADAEKKLQERRAAVRADLVKAMLNTTEPTDMTSTAIDRIIELEDGQAMA